MIALGIDLGGTKSEIRLFDAHWQVADHRRDDTPDTYPELIAMLARQVAWAAAIVGRDLPVGLAAPGQVRADGRLIAANHAAHGQDLPRDLAKATGQQIHFLNDGQAFALSEAGLGRGKGAGTMLGLILGTGIGGAALYEGTLPRCVALDFGEFGHSPLSARVAAAHDLPILTCGCGQVGCVETLGSGPGLSRLAQHLTGHTMSPQDIAAKKGVDDQAALVWQVWIEIIADLALSLTHATGAMRIVLGGGLSQMNGLCGDLQSALAKVQLPNCPAAEIVLAEGGDASGARGAAWFAFHKVAGLRTH